MGASVPTRKCELLTRTSSDEEVCYTAASWVAGPELALLLSVAPHFMSARIAPRGGTALARTSKALAAAPQKQRCSPIQVVQPVLNTHKQSVQVANAQKQSIQMANAHKQSKPQMANAHKQSNGQRP